MSFGIYHRAPAPTGTRTSASTASTTEPPRHRCAIDFTADELASLAGRANRAGLTASDYVRAIVLNTEPALADLLTAARLTHGLSRGIMGDKAATPEARANRDRLEAEASAVCAAIEGAASMIGVRLG
jgi:hypothetical protein